MIYLYYENGYSRAVSYKWGWYGEITQVSAFRSLIKMQVHVIPSYIDAFSGVSLLVHTTYDN